MAHPNIDERRATVGQVLKAGIEIKEREARVLAALYSCSPSAILADARSWRAEPPRKPEPMFPPASG